MPSFQRSTDGQFFVDGSTGGGGGIAEAPTNGSLYGRQDAGWVIVPAPTPPFTGGTLTGKLTLTPAQQTNPSDAATRGQAVLLATASTMTAKLTLAPAQQSAANDAVTRGQAFPATVVTGNYAAADTAITSLLTALAAAGFIVNNTTPVP